MKKYPFLILLFCSHSFLSFSQLNKKNKWGLSLALNSIQGQIAIPLTTGPGAVIVDADGNILTKGNRIDNSFSFSIIPKYYLNSDVLVRLEFGITNLSLRSNSDSKSGSTHTVSEIQLTHKIFKYAFGVQWFFFKEKKIESYFGLTASYIDYQTINYNIYNEHRNLITDAITDWERDKETTPGGMAFGLGAYTGFTIYLQKHLSIGAELSSLALYYKLGGTTISEGTEQTPPNSIITYNSSYSNSYKGFKISKIISSFNISFRL